MNKVILMGRLVADPEVRDTGKGKDALAVVSEGPPGQYEDNPTVNEYKAKGYKLVDGNMFGQGNETGEILIFVKIL